MKKTFALFSLFFSLLMLGGCLEDLDKVTVETLSSSEVEFDTATLHGKLTIKGNPVIKEYGFFYGTSPNPTLRIEVTGSVPSNSSTLPFYADLKGLEDDTQYYFQAYVIDGSNQLIKGEEFSFVTKPQPTVTIDNMTMKRIGVDSSYRYTYQMDGEASLNCTGYTAVQAGFIFSAYKGLSASDVTSPGLAHKEQCEIRDNKIYLDIETDDSRNISSGSTYIMAYMILDNGWIVTSEVQNVSIYDVQGEAQAVTEAASDITYNSAKLNGALKLTGNATFTEYGFYYGTVSTPDVKVKVNGSFTGAELNYSADINKLEDNTKYFFQAYGVDISGHTVKGSVLNFTTNLKPSIEMNSMTLTFLGMDNTFRDRYNLKGTATLHPEGNAVKEAGFIYSSYSGVGASAVTSSAAGKIVCEIVNNRISVDKEVIDSSNIYGRSTYILAYMILENGTVFVSPTQKISAN